MVSLVCGIRAKSEAVGGGSLKSDQEIIKPQSQHLSGPLRVLLLSLGSRIEVLGFSVEG